MNIKLDFQCMKTVGGGSFFWVLLVLVSCNSSRPLHADFLYASLDVRRDSNFLLLEFHSNRKMIFDWKVTSEVCYSDEDTLVLSGDFSSKKLIAHLKHNQLIVVNRLGEKKFFMETNRCKYYESDIELENCYVDWFQQIFQDTTLKIPIPNKESIKVSCNDKEVKFYYLFRPNKKQLSLGFDTMFIESNWLNLNDY